MEDITATHLDTIESVALNFATKKRYNDKYRRGNYVFESVETVNEDSAWRWEEERKAFARQAAEKESKLREEEAAREQAAAVQEREKEIEWINQEAEESILILAGMGERPKNPLAIGYAQMLHEDYIRRLVERADDLLEYLWDKAHSGDWICPEIKDTLKLDQLLELILQLEASDSYFPTGMQELAASLLRKWRGEDCDETDDSDEMDDSASPTQEATSQTGSDPDTVFFSRLATVITICEEDAPAVTV
ncbi:hypothetical protein UCDDA912_g08784 [Diaporthe ampelina]|uniref:Uncharacterized protein n=1 Tax=Diaporthe ampelina TaxID=1214573 RepID=A0A0G2H7T5_9PEZI|nr:hypothetical protein UCDDA912_g08784 [Diaporthe ampelina]